MHFVQAKSLLTKWNGMNIYRGCSHGCIYCDSRSAVNCLLKAKANMITIGSTLKWYPD